MKRCLSVLESCCEKEASKREMPTECLALRRHIVSGGFRLLPTQNNIGDFSLNLPQEGVNEERGVGLGPSFYRKARGK